MVNQVMLYGLVDAMLSFGCKGPLRMSIITENNWFDTANEMAEYLQTFFQNDESKHYHLIDPKDNAEKRKQFRQGHEIKGCRKLHLISVSSSGVFTTKTILNSEDNNLLNLHFDTEVDLDDSMNAEVDDLFTHSNANEDEVIDSSVLFSVIEPETYIGLPTSSLELFFVIKVVSKRIAEVNKVDTHGHAIIAGEAYVVGNYLEKKETKKACWI